MYQWKMENSLWVLSCSRAQRSAKKDLVLKCIKLVQETGVQVVSLTFDGAQSNISMSNMLGCHIQFPDPKTYFKVENRCIHVFYDPPHMLKLIRNCFGEKKLLIDVDGNVIDWQFLLSLNNVQEMEGLYLANKLRRAHLNFFKQKMKVRLAALHLFQFVFLYYLFFVHYLAVNYIVRCLCISVYSFVTIYLFLFFLYIILL